MKFLISVVILGISSILYSTGYSAIKNTTYSDISQKHKFDIFIPNNSSVKHPLIVFLHGGGFFYGDKSELLTPQGFSLIENAILHGFAIAFVNYRLIDEGKFPTAVEDVKGAIRYIRANARDFNIDSNRIIVWGIEVGGSIASIIGTSAVHNIFENTKLGNLNISSRVQAVVNWEGISNWKHLFDYYEDGFYKSNQSFGYMYFANHYFGSKYSDEYGLYKASPLKYVSKHSPPFIIQHLDSDYEIPKTQSKVLYDRLVMHNIKVYYKEVKVDKTVNDKFHSFFQKNNLDSIFGQLKSLLRLV